jgi:hypothetical protein
MLKRVLAEFERRLMVQNEQVVKVIPLSFDVWNLYTVMLLRYHWIFFIAQEHVERTYAAGR